MNIDEHIKGTCKSSYMHLCNISRIQRYVTKDACATIIFSLLISRFKTTSMPCCMDCLAPTLHKLQVIQNQVAKSVAHQKKCDHVTPIMISLHWLPVLYRIQHNILLLTHRCVHGDTPGYRSSLLKAYEQQYTPHSAKQYLLKERMMHVKTYDDHVFCVCGTPC